MNSGLFYSKFRIFREWARNFTAEWLKLKVVPKIRNAYVIIQKTFENFKFWKKALKQAKNLNNSKKTVLVWMLQLALIFIVCQLFILSAQCLKIPIRMNNLNSYKMNESTICRGWIYQFLSGVFTTILSTLRSLL